ncbi:purine-binding chemotaxis protein CheW [Rhodovulum bhavnagarense]|uniref:Chemotaxis protein CheW n=1 Tax=Rhodovulum bhavnagarense TaxID=992286 RepID=A0A4R2RD69_9RHOB|nr:chemotaxis protein CheW [Rhodovulum bhavnagarense]TCP61372.1 purine-binding chemotaxis protein CheW [Rhodovulum bhavnagarense]
MTDFTELDPEPAASDLASDENSIRDMYLIFIVEDEEYGVGIEYVTEIVGLQRIMSVPDVPDFIKGVINLRGNVIPVMDVRLRFGMAERAHDSRTVIVVLEVGDAPIGLVVDGVRDVREIPEDCVDPAPKGRDSTALPITRGLGRHGDQVAILIDVQNLMQSNADPVKRAATALAGADAVPPTGDAARETGLAAIA